MSRIAPPEAAVVSPALAHSLLVIEDEAGDFGLIEAYLRHSGHRINAQPPVLTWVQTLSEGIAAATRAQPDVILLDLMLPDASGMETLQAVIAALPGIPVVILTGHDDEGIATAALEAGAQDYLVKGQFDQRTLARTLRHALVRGRLESHLRQSEERLELALSCSGLAMWDLDIPTGEIITNPRWLEMLGYQPGEITPSGSSWEQLTHPDDMYIQRENFADHLRGDTPIYEGEYRMRHKIGHWVWVLSRGRVIRRDVQGTPLRALGTSLDVSQQKRLNLESADLLRRIENLIREAGEHPGMRLSGRDKPEESAPIPLSTRQRQVLVLIAQGLTSNAIATRLHISPATAATHRRDLMQKLDLHSTAELTRYVITHRLTEQ